MGLTLQRSKARRAGAGLVEQISWQTKPQEELRGSLESFSKMPPGRKLPSYNKPGPGDAKFRVIRPLAKPSGDCHAMKMLSARRESAVSPLGIGWFRSHIDGPFSRRQLSGGRMFRLVLFLLVTSLLVCRSKRCASQQGRMDTEDDKNTLERLGIMISGELEGLLGDPPLLEGGDPDLYGGLLDVLQASVHRAHAGEMFSALNLSDIDADAKLRKPGQTEGSSLQFLATYVPNLAAVAQSSHYGFRSREDASLLTRAERRFRRSGRLSK